MPARKNDRRRTLGRSVSRTPESENQPSLFDKSFSVVNVASVKHRSLFRYPGGKTWLVPQIRKWLGSLPRKPAEFAEPFAGGGIVGLSVLFEDLARQLTLVEKDEDVGSVWQAILTGQDEELAKRIRSFKVSEAAVRAVLTAKPRANIDRAFATIIRNRMQRGGIMARGAALMKSGENGKGLTSRWYAATLAQRIADIAAHRDRITFICGDGLRYIESNAKRRDIVFFIDPPYTVAGRRLYTHSELDHEKLFKAAAKSRGDFLMTYDNAAPVHDLARRHGFAVKEIPMKNTHNVLMTELLIGRNLDWVRG